jgi:HEAT repeat protein
MARFLLYRLLGGFRERLWPMPSCGLDIRKFWDSKDHVQKLILALNHPEPSTPVRAAWLLGKTKDPRAVDALVDLITEGKERYIVRAAINALTEMNTAKAREVLATLLDHRDRTVRILVKRILEERPDTSGQTFRT